MWPPPLLPQGGLEGNVLNSTLQQSVLLYIELQCSNVQKCTALYCTVHHITSELCTELKRTVQA